jgi:release factor glutamine methyltransferase
LEDAWVNLPLDVRAFEPRLALDGGPDGLVVYRRLIAEAKKFLRPGGWLVLEMGAGQSGDCIQIAKANGGYGPARVIADGAGIDRIISLQKR